MIWHSQDITSVLSELQTDTQNGLSSDEAAARLKTYGKNTIESVSMPAVSSFVPWFFSKTSILLLVLAALWSIVAAIWKTVSFWEAGYLLAFVILKGVIAGSFAYGGRRGIRTLCGGQKPTATVLREGQIREILCEELVPGDIVLLKKGDLVPADCRLITSHALHCDEGALRGGHSQIEKTADTLETPDIAPLEQRKNMLYMGCAVLNGEATAVVTDTGAATELGKQAHQTGAEDLAGLSCSGDITGIRRLSVLGNGILCVLLLLAGILRGLFTDTAFWGNLLFWITIAVCASAAFLPDKTMPAGYILCYLKLRQMRKRKITVSCLKTLDKLKNISVICCDKTGSVTKSGRMELQQIYDGKGIYNIQELSESAARVLHLAALCCDGKVEMQNGKEKRSGDSTQTAIISAALKQLHLTEEDLRVSYPRMTAIPFNRERKTMCTVNMIDGKNFAIVRGTPDKIMPMCPNTDISSVSAVQTAMASRALRVIAVAVKPLNAVPANPTGEMLECNLQFIGLLGLYNPPRKDARPAVESCRKIGIKTVMLTGDDLENASAYARSLGILTSDIQALDATTLAQMPDTQLADEIDQYSVFAGVSSEIKPRIVRALQAAGHTVLMTGDAIEDIAALRAADIGCTPAGLGTDIAKDASDLVVSGGLAAIASSIIHARHLFHSIRSVYALLCSMGILLLLFTLLSTVTGTVFTFAQILLCGLLAAVGLPLYFGTAKSAPPQGAEQKQPLMLLSIAAITVWLAALAAGYLLSGDTNTLLFSTLLCSYALLAYRISLARAVHKNFRYAAVHLLPALCFVGLLILLTCFAPAFKFVPLALPVWLLVFAFSCIGTGIYMLTNKIRS